MLLRARTLLPVSSPPLDNGTVFIASGRIVALGTWPELRRQFPSAPVCDLGERLVLPGLVNAHCHLDYTGMAGLIPPTRSFTEWICHILQIKAHWSYTDYAESWLLGARQLLRSGCTTVLDIEAVPELLPDVWSATALRVISALELTGVRSRRAPADILHDAERTMAALPPGRCAAALSPHAPYSTSPELLRLAARTARRLGCPITTHVAESAEEFEMFTRRRGAMARWLGEQRGLEDCGHRSPVAHVAHCGLLRDNFLAVHVNHLAEGDARLLSRGRAHVVHCPRSHAYFAHARFPLGELAAAGVNLCLGTDSLASTLKHAGRRPELNLFHEMQSLVRAEPGLAPDAVLQMATTRAARALGRAGLVGELAPGAHADIIVLPAAPPAQAAESAVHHAGPVEAVMTGGAWQQV